MNSTTARNQQKHWFFTQCFFYNKLCSFILVLAGSAQNRKPQTLTVWHQASRKLCILGHGSLAGQQWLLDSLASGYVQMSLGQSPHKWCNGEGDYPSNTAHRTCSSAGGGASPVTIAQGHRDASWSISQPSQDPDEEKGTDIILLRVEIHSGSDHLGSIWVPEAQMTKKTH